MGDEGSRRVVERVAEAIDRIGDDRHDAEPTDQAAEAATDGSEQGEPVTDGGADGAPPGNSSWAEDDPIAFDEESEEDPGAAILEAVTDEDDSLSSLEGFGADASGVDDTHSDDRLDELEARIGALESDHAQLESQMADVEDAVAALGVDVERVGDDVLELVTLLGGVALATGPAEGPDLDPAEVANALASEVEESAAAAAVEAIENADVGPRGTDARPQADTESDARSQIDTESGARSHADAASDAQSGAEAGSAARSQDETEAESATTPEVGRNSDDDGQVTRDDPELDPDSIPEGIHRGVDDTDPRDGSDRNGGEHSRELVDPRTDAVGARLRQFREGFVDDPTEDLPTGSSADDFRFEKVLLPTEGEEAPDLSTDELEKPYLEALPDGYAADAVVLEWLDWLVSAADGETAARAVGYYESIDWLTEDARAELLGYLDGLGDMGAVDGSTPVHEPPSALDLQDHLRSLQYVTELATGEVDPDGI